MTTFKMKEMAVSFATRPRAAEIAREIRGKSVTIDFTGVLAASPSFVDEFVGLVAQNSEAVCFEGLSPQLVDLFDRIVADRSLESRVRIATTA